MIEHAQPFEYTVGRFKLARLIIPVGHQVKLFQLWSGNTFKHGQGSALSQEAFQCLINVSRGGVCLSVHGFP